MRKGIALLAVVASPLAMSADMPTVYGKINKVFVNTNQEDVHARKSSEGVTDVANSVSRIGVKGGMDADGMKVSYKLELGLNSTADTGAGTVALRNAQVSLAHTYGTLTFGQMYNQISALGLAADPMAENIAGFQGADVKARVASATGSVGFTYRGRVDGVSYTTPSMMGLTYTIAQDKNNKNDNNTDGVASHTEHVVAYKRDLGGMDLNLYVAYDMTNQVGTKDNKEMVYGLGLGKDAFKFNFAMSAYESTAAGSTTAEEIDRMFGALSYTMNKHNVAFTYQTKDTTNTGGTKDAKNEVTQMAIGYKHQCTTAMDLNLTVAKYEYNLTTSGATSADKKAVDNDATLIAAGIQVKF